MTKLKQGSTVELNSLALQIARVNVELNSLALQIASVKPPETKGLKETQLEEADDDEAEGSE